MKIVYMNGGLGNQIFQYIFMRWVETISEEECIIDDHAFFGEKVPHNGYQLETLFGIKKKRLSECFSDKVWETMLCQKAEKSIPQQLLCSGIPLSMIFEAGTMQFMGNVVNVSPQSMLPLKVEGDWYFQGYWLQDVFFKAMGDVIRQELVFPAIDDTKNQVYQDQIRNTESVGIHIRRGDMVGLGWSMDESYFQDTIQYFVGKVAQAHYFVFSDDLPWCQEHVKELGLDVVGSQVTFVEGNEGESSYRDLQLMSMCKHIIASRSSFSLLAAVLNTNEKKIVITP